MKKKSKHTENLKLKAVANESANKMRGMDNFIPPIPEPGSFKSYIIPEGKTIDNYPFPPSIIRQPLIFTDRFWDNTLALSLMSGFICLGVVLGMSLK